MQLTRVTHPASAAGSPSRSPKFRKKSTAWFAMTALGVTL